MLRKYVTLVLLAGVFNLFFVATGSAGTNEEKKRAARAEKTKAGIVKLGTGPNAKVEIKLYDKTAFKGHVQEASVDHFLLVDTKTGVATEIPYNSVKQIRGNNLATGVKIAIGVGLILLLAIIIATQTS